MQQEYFQRGMFLTFLWKPKPFYRQLQQEPILLFPILVLIVLMVLGEGIVFFVTDFKGFSTLTFGLSIHVLTTFFLIFVTALYFYIVFRLAKNKQSLQLILSIVVHAYIASLYGTLLIQLFVAIFGPFESIWSFFVSPGFVLFFVYLGIGLNAGLSVTNGQFLFAFLSYIFLSLIVVVILFIILFFLLMTLFNDILGIFQEFFRIIFEPLSH